MPVELPSNFNPSGENSFPAKERQTCESKNNGQVFTWVNKGRARMQYASGYFSRLDYLEVPASEQARLEWPATPVITLSDLMKLSGSEEESIIVGILHKQMRLKPSVLDRYTKGLDIPEFTANNRVHDEDMSYIESRLGRLELGWPSKDTINALTTGMIVALKGRLGPCGRFFVSGYVLPGSDFMPDGRFQLTPRGDMNPDAPLTAFVSNTKIAESTDFNKLVALRSLILSDSAISRLVVVGNAVGRLQPAGNPIGEGRNDAKFSTADVDDNALVAMHEMDAFLEQIAAVIPVDLMVGPEDPTTYALPQLPLPRRIFPQSSAYEGFQSLSNPGLITLPSDRRVLMAGTQPVEDMIRYTTMTRPLDCLETSFKAMIVAPTAPDTIACVPMDLNDVLCIPTPHGGAPADAFETRDEYQEGTRARLPDVYISGGHEKTEYSRLRSTKDQMEATLLCLGDFQTTGDVVLLDAERMELTKQTILG